MIQGPQCYINISEKLKKFSEREFTP